MVKLRKNGGGGGVGGIKGRRKSRSNKMVQHLVKNNKGAVEGPKPNPFDLVFAGRQKNVVSIGKFQRPLARSKQDSTEIRKRTLDIEFQRRRKANQISDKRIGQRDIEMSEEAKAEKRFLFQQKKLIEKRTEMESNANGANMLDARKKVHWEDLKDGDNGEQEDSDKEENEDELGHEEKSGGNDLTIRKSRKETISEMIATDRRMRAIKSMLRDEQEEQTEHLDKCYRQMRELGMLQSGNRAAGAGKAVAENGGTKEVMAVDPYDSMYRVLQYEPTATITKLGSNEPPSAANIPSSSSSVIMPEKRPTKQQIPDFQEAMEEFDQILKGAGGIDFCTGRMREHIKEKLHPALKKSPHMSSRIVLEKLRELRDQFLESDETGAESPNFRQIAYIQLISALFPVHAPFHPISTPTLMFALELLGGSRIRDLSQCGRLILLCAFLFHWTGPSGRYLPEVIATLLGALQLCVPQPNQNEQFPTMSFPISQPHREMLCANSKMCLEHFPENERLSLSSIFTDSKNMEGEQAEEDQTSQKCLIIRLLLRTIRQYAEKYSNNCRLSYNAIFSPFHRLCLRLPLVNYPPELAKEAEELRVFLACKLAETATVTQMKISVRKGPRALKMLEPRFDEHFNPERPNNKGRMGIKEREKNWAKRVRKERRGAIKELRKDARHLAGLYSEQQRKIRRERDDKTKRILQTLEVQESEYKKLRAISGKF